MKYLFLISLVYLFLFVLFPQNLIATQNNSTVNKRINLVELQNVSTHPGSLQKQILTVRKKIKSEKEDSPQKLIRTAKKLAIASLIMIPLSIIGLLPLILVFAIMSMSKIKKAKRMLKAEPVEDMPELLKKADDARTLAILGFIAFGILGIVYLVAMYQLLY